ncbi:MAG: acyltransferase [Paucibacter sp.]|nr:acyltransferase [Roseateles sp.]
MRSERGEGRIPGLDLLRAAAIALVLVYHYAVVVGPLPRVPGMTALGWCGVDLFFVLSGYLIGNQVLSGVARGGGLALGNFFARRLLRTLPNYVVVLAVYWLLPQRLSGRHTAELWRFLTFTQNFGLQYGETFTHSWSLCIEEQFYLLLPLVVLAVARGRHAAAQCWAVLVAALVLGIAARGHAFVVDGHGSFSAEVYYGSTTRFDELLPGVAIAMLRNFHPALFERVLKRGLMWLVGGLSLVILCLNLWMAGDEPTLVGASVGFSMLAIGFGLMTLSALSPASLLNRWQVPGAAQLALWSYAIYLAHKPAYKLLADAMRAQGLATDTRWALIAIVAAGIAAGWLLYRLVEQPFMGLRSQWFPSESRASRVPHQPVVHFQCTK